MWGKLLKSLFLYIKIYLYMEKRQYSLQELKDISINCNVKYYLADIWEIRDQYLALTPEQIAQSFEFQSTLPIIYIMMGDLHKARELIDNITLEPIKLLVEIALPLNTDIEFFKTVQRLRALNMTSFHLTFSAGRPSFINGVRDFTRYGIFLKKYKNVAINALKTLYGSLAPEIYDIALAEYLYQKNQCVDAMMLITGVLPKLEKAGDMRALFVALHLQMAILLVRGESESVSNMVKELHLRLSKEGSAELTYNIDALEAWLYIYEGNIDKVTDWMENKAPDEHCDFNMLDLYRYMVKMRCYLLTGKYMALISLSEKLRPYLREGHRRMDLCEMDVIVAMADFQVCKFEEAYNALELAFKNAKRYDFDRLIGDEGSLMVKLLIKYRKDRPNSKYINYANKVLDIARSVAISYPDYLVLPYKKEMSFTNTEKDILKLMYNGKSYEEIADFYDISINTVRYHIKNLYSKMDVNSSKKALSKAKTLGLL